MNTGCGSRVLHDNNTIIPFTLRHVHLQPFFRKFLPCIHSSVEPPRTRGGNKLKGGSRVGHEQETWKITTDGLGAEIHSLTIEVSYIHTSMSVSAGRVQRSQENSKQIYPLLSNFQGLDNTGKFREGSLTKNTPQKGFVERHYYCYYDCGDTCFCVYCNVLSQPARQSSLAKKKWSVGGT